MGVDGVLVGWNRGTSARDENTHHKGSVAKVLCFGTYGCGFDPSHGGCFSHGGGKRKHRCVELLMCVGGPRVVEINPEPASLAQV